MRVKAGSTEPGCSAAASPRVFRWSRRLMLVAAVLTCVGALVSPASADRVFTARFPGPNESGNVTGNITMIANTLETCPVDAAGQAGCSNAQAGGAGAGAYRDGRGQRRARAGAQ